MLNRPTFGGHIRDIPPSISLPGKTDVYQVEE